MKKIGHDKTIENRFENTTNTYVKMSKMIIEQILKAEGWRKNDDKRRGTFIWTEF